MIATWETRGKAAEVARRFTGWTLADDWDELETELAAQAKFDAERLSNQAPYGLPCL